MSRRLQVLIPNELETRLRKAAQRSGISKGEWVRRANEASLRGSRTGGHADPVSELASLNAPSGDIEQMLAETEAGRS